MKAEPFFSIITVTLNNSAGLTRTLQSLEGQAFQDFELLGIDGGSSDGTLYVWENYSKLAKSILVEPDRGVYDAMNKGIIRTVGTWVLFLNSGDVLENPQVLQMFFEILSASDATVIYGQYLTDTARLVVPLPLSTAKNLGLPFCHQAAFFHRERCGRDLYFDLRFPVFSDWDLVLRLMRRDNTRFFYAPLLVCRYESGGLSSGFSLERVGERIKLLYSHGGIRRVFVGVLSKLTYEWEKWWKHGAASFKNWPC